MSNPDDIRPGASAGDQIAASLTDHAANDDAQQFYRPRSPSEALEPERAPEPPVRKKRRRTHPVLMLINGAMTLSVIGMLALGGLIYFAKSQFDKAGPLQHSTVVVIPKGEGVNAIAARLERDGIIADRRIFVASVIYFKAQEKLKAGEFEIRKHASMRDVLDTLVEGRAILHKVTIPEGLTSEQIVARLNEEEMLVGEITTIPAEGTLLPDTYRFSRGMTRQELIKRMQAEQKKFIDKLWPTRSKNLPFSTKQEAVTLASIVEKETGRADERSRIAGVFVNRLSKNMRLQSDPTIIYGLVGGKGTLGRPILKSEIEQDTPYNTYRINGLPPGPIANPGRAAIEAVMRPSNTKDLYFVADGTGGHVFSRSLSDHNQKVAQWRKIEAERRAKEEEEARLSAANAAAQSGINPGAGAFNTQMAGDGVTMPAGTATTSTPFPGFAVSGIGGIVVESPTTSPFAALPGPIQIPETAAAPIANTATRNAATTAAQPAAQPAAAENAGTTVPLPLRNPLPR